MGVSARSGNFLERPWKTLLTHVSHHIHILTRSMAHAVANEISALSDGI